MSTGIDVCTNAAWMQAWTHAWMHASMHAWMHGCMGFPYALHMIWLCFAVSDSNVFSMFSFVVLMLCSMFSMCSLCVSHFPLFVLCFLCVSYVLLMFYLCFPHAWPQCVSYAIPMFSVARRTSIKDHPVYGTGHSLAFPVFRCFSYVSYVLLHVSCLSFVCLCKKISDR